MIRFQNSNKISGKWLTSPAERFFPANISIIRKIDLHKHFQINPSWVLKWYPPVCCVTFQTPLFGGNRFKTLHGSIGLGLDDWLSRFQQCITLFHKKCKKWLTSPAERFSPRTSASLEKSIYTKHFSNKPFMGSKVVSDFGLA